MHTMPYYKHWRKENVLSCEDNVRSGHKQTNKKFMLPYFHILETYEYSYSSSENTSKEMYGGRARSKINHNQVACCAHAMVVRGYRCSNGGGHGRPGIRCGMHPQQTAAEGKENPLVDTVAPRTHSLCYSNEFTLFFVSGEI